MAPVARQTAVTSTQPRVQTNGTGVCIKHREYIMDFNGSDGFSVDATLAIQPGDQNTFPWLAAIARRYESYRFSRLRFLYKTTSATSAGGTMLLTIDYDAADAAPLSKQQAMAYTSSTRMAPWQDSSIDCKPSDLMRKPSYYVRSGSVPNTDIKTYDVGNLFLISESATKGTGELYVEYDVHLFTPQLELYSEMGKIISEGAGAVTKTTIFGTGVPVSNFGLSYRYDSSKVYITPNSVGSFFIYIQVRGTGTTNPNSSIDGGVIAGVQATADPEGLIATNIYVVTFNGKSSEIEFDYAACTTVTSASMYWTKAVTGVIE